MATTWVTKWGHAGRRLALSLESAACTAASAAPGRTSAGAGPMATAMAAAQLTRFSSSSPALMSSASTPAGLSFALARALPLPLQRPYFTRSKVNKNEPDRELHLVDERILDLNIEDVRVVASDGGHEVLSVKRALAKAKRSNLNLVVVNQSAKPPVCRLMDYSFYKFSQTKKDKERKSNQSARAKKRKEVQLGTNISSGHLEMKYNTIVKFLEKKHQVKITAVDARGDDLKEAFLEELRKKVEEDGYVIVEPVKVFQARKASITVNPKKK